MNFRLFGILLFVISSLWLHATDSTFSWTAWKKTWPRGTLNSDVVLPPVDSNLIRSVDVIDMRSDTTCIGLRSNKHYQPVAITMDTTLAVWINRKLSNNPLGYDLVIVVKNFWIIEVKEFIYRDTKKIVPDDNLALAGRRVKLVTCTKLTCNFDVFIQQAGDYYPLARFDTALLLVQAGDVTDELAVGKAFFMLSRKISRSIYLNRYQSKKPATKVSIAENYRKTFQIPILAGSAIKTGIFYTWEQLKKNEPDTLTYTFKKVDSDVFLFVKNKNGIETIMQNAFALCDEGKLYRVYRGFVYKMYRDENSFYWMGNGHVKMKNIFIPLALPLPGITVGGIESLAMKIEFLQFPYLLNHETGMPY